MPSLKSIKKRLYMLIGFIIMIFCIVIINYSSYMITDESNHKANTITKLEKDVFETIIAENNSLQLLSGDMEVKDRYFNLTQSCNTCHNNADFVYLFQRKELFNQLYQIEHKSSKLYKSIHNKLHDLFESVRYIHKHHIVYFKNLLQRKEVNQDYDHKIISQRSSIQSASEVDIIDSAISIQSSLNDLIECFYDLQHTQTLPEIKQRFSVKIKKFYENVNIFEDYSLDAQDGILVEELLMEGRNFEKLFVDLELLEHQKIILNQKLYKNQEQLLELFDFMSIKINKTNRVISKYIQPLQLVTILLTIFVVFRIVVDGKQIINAFIRTVDETEIIQKDLSYQIIVDNSVFDEFQIIFKALNSMAHRININILALIESKERYSLAVKGGQVGVWDWNFNTEQVFISPYLKTLIGYKEHEIPNKIEELFKHVYYKDKFKILKSVLQCIKGKKDIFHCEHRILHKDKSIRWFLASAKIERNQDGILTRFIGTYKDITERKKAEEALRQSEERYRCFFEDDLSGAFIAQANGTLIVCNPAFSDMFRFDIKEMKAFNFFSFYPDIAKQDEFLSLLYKNKRLERHESLLFAGNGSKVNVIQNVVGVFDGNNNLKEIRGYLIDVTKQKKLEKQLLQAQKMESIGTLAGGIAHDFNNILFPIFGYTQMAMDSLPENSTALPDLEQVLNAATRAKELVQQILAFSRQNDQEKFGAIKIQSIVKETLKLIRASIPNTITISSDIDDECDSILSNPTHIHQVIMNLCTNAYHAMKKQGHGDLKVSLKTITISDKEVVHYENVNIQPGKYLQLSVSDTGHGIDPNIIERIFDPYFTTKKIGEGTGMGLSVIHGIVTNHGGQIIVDSKLGQGTTFTIFFPIYIDQIQPVQIQEKQDFAIPQGKEHILLVDDEDMIANMLQHILEGLGYKVTSRTDSQQAFETFDLLSEIFDLVITDFAMPKMTGIKLAEKIKKIKPDIPIILCTGYKEEIDENNIHNIDINEIIIKPVTKYELAITIRNVLDRELAS